MHAAALEQPRAGWGSSDAGRPGSGRAGPVWPAVLLSALATAALYGLLYVQNPRFFYIDDRIADALPKLVDIGRLVSSGQWPWLTTSAVNSGAHALEYQNGVFNPLLVGLGVVLSRMDDLALGSFLVVLVHALLLSGAAAWLGRVVGLGTSWSVAVAVSVAFQPYTVFWGAAAWLQAITSFSWFVLAVAAALAFHLEPRRRYGWLLLAATYGCFTSGWPLAIPVLGLFVLALLVARLLARSDLVATVWLGVWAAGGAACSLVALYPLTRSFEFAARSSAILNESNFNVVPLDALLQFANPAYYGFFFNFGGYELQELPHFYVAWFALPVLVLWRPGRLPALFHTVVVVAGVMLVVSVLGALGPERLLVFRFPTRFLQYSGFFLVLLVAVVVAQGRFRFDRSRLRWALGLVALLALLSLQADPRGAGRVLPFALGTAALVCALCLAGRAVRWHRMPSTGLVAALGTVLVMTAVAAENPAGRGMDWRFPADVSTLDTLSLEDYTLFYGNYVPGDLEDAVGFHEEYHPSGTGLLVGDRQINGYSPLGHTAFRRSFPIDDQGNFAPDAASDFTAVDPATGLSALELFRVDQIIAQKGGYTDDLQAQLGPQWRRAITRQYTTVWRHDAYDLPGLVSYADPALEVSAPPGCESRDLSECVQVASSGRGPARLVFARLWFPGYTAVLDGEPLPVQRHADTLVAVDVPAGAQGELVLSYRSPHVRKLALLAGIVVLSLAVASCGPVRSAVGRRRRRARVLEPAEP